MALHPFFFGGLRCRHSFEKRTSPCAISKQNFFYLDLCAVSCSVEAT